MESGPIDGTSGRADAQPIVPLHGRRRTLAFAALMVGFTMDVVDGTIVNIAIPSIQAGLGASTIAIQWVLAGYFLSFATLLVSGGRLGDLLGYRRMFLIGMAGFTLASILCGIAMSPGQLIGARLLQGAAGALMAPQVMGLIQILYSPIERVAALSWFGLIGGLAAVLGPTIGGLLIEADPQGLGWRLIFLVNAPIGLIGLLAAWRLLPSGRSPHPLTLDWTGTALLSAALLALLFPLIQGREFGWPLWCFALLALAPLLMAAFWRHSARRVRSTGSALIAPELFREPTFSLGLASSLLFTAATAGFLLPFSIAMQQGLGFSAFETSLIHVPFAIGVMAGISLIGRNALPTYGRWVVVAGAVIMIVSLGALGAAVSAGGTSLPILLLCLLASGIGMGTVAGPLPPITLARVDTGHAGVAGGMHKSVQQIGGALGTAVIGTLFFSLLGGRGGAAEAFRWTLPAVAFALLLLIVCALRMPRGIFRQVGRKPGR